MKKRIVFILFLFVSHMICLGQTTIHMERDGGVYKVPCTVNGLKLKLIFDTGASSVSISSTVANMMLENGYLSKNDIKDTGQSIIADGQIVDHTRIILREIEIGGCVLKNVDAVVMHQLSAPLLLGQSAIQKLGKVSISGDALIINASSNSSISKNYSFDELWSMYKEAQDFRSNNMPLLAVEKYDVLYKNDFLLEADLLDYAECLNSPEVNRNQEALEIYLSLESWIKQNYPSDIPWILGSICNSAYFSKDYQTAIRYGQLAQLKMDVLNLNYYFATLWMYYSYRDMGNSFQAKYTLEQYIKKYTSFMGITPTDCWDKEYTDPNIANAYNAIRYIYETYGEAKKYILIAAAWGSKEAIEDCKKFDWNYKVKPNDYVY